MSLTQKLSKLAPAFVIASVWITVYIGPGFASGSMLVGFFVSKSWLGVFVGPTLTTLFAASMTFCVMEFSRIHEAQDFRMLYDAVFGKYRYFFATLKDTSIIVSIFVVGSLSFAAGGRLLSEITGVSHMLCGAIIMIIISAMVLGGRWLLIRISIWTTISLLTVVIAIVVVALPTAWPKMLEYVGNRTMNETPFRVWLNIILFTNIMTAFTDAAIPLSRGVIKTRSDSIQAAVVGGILVLVATIGMNIVLSSGMPDIAKVQLPTLWVVTNIVDAAWLKIAYNIVAIVAIVTTLGNFLFGVLTRYQRVLDKKLPSLAGLRGRVLMLLIVSASAFYFGGAGVPVVAMRGYSLMGYINTPFLEIPMLIIISVSLYRMGKKKASSTLG